MYDERYDPELHPEDGVQGSPTLNRLVMISAVLSGGLLLYAVVTAIS